MHVPRRGAVRDHGDGLVRRMRGIREDLHVEHGGQAAQALRADAKRVHLVIELDAQFLVLVLRPARLQVGHVDRRHQRLLGHHHGFLGGAADADAEHARRAPARAHGGHRLQHPVDNRIGRIEHRELGLRLRAAALGGDIHRHRGSGHHFHVDHGRRVVLRVAARELRILEHRRAQLVVRVVVGAAHAFVHRVGQRALDALEAHVDADLQEHVDDARVLAERAVAFGAHARIGQDLRDRVLRRRGLLALVGTTEGADVVRRVVVGNELQGVGDALHQVLAADDGRHDRGLTGELRRTLNLAYA
jgi:hypothetical protein